MKKALEAAMKHGKISAPSIFAVSDTFPLTISITSISPQSGCTPACNALGKRIATGCAKNKTDAVFLSMVEGVERYCIQYSDCLLYTSPSPRDRQKSRMPSSA